jgi:hypothetical protein
MAIRPHDRSMQGQAMVLVGLGMVVLIGMVGVVVDVGMQWADNRGSQNGSDAIAHAGTVVIMEHLSSGDPALDDAAVDAAITAMASEAGVELEEAEYTDWQGIQMGISVGGGGAIPTGAQGLYVESSRAHQTVFARIVGINELSVQTDATAVTGTDDNPCDEGALCPLLPVTFPNTQVTCDGQNKSILTEDPWDLGVDLVLPLCGNNPGSVGWIDWTPPAGGSDELAAAICNPHSAVDLPDWFYVTAPGNTNSGPVQTCFEQWLLKPILVPLFDDTCRNDPLENNPCPIGEDAVGQNSWYHFPTYAAFYLTGVYIQGNHKATCDTGNGATSCLTGRFVDTSGTGTVGQYIPPDPDAEPVSEFWVIQLIH